MAALYAYLDDSGGKDNRLSAFAACIATREQWLGFETDWLATLDRFGIQPPFHMNKFSGPFGQYARLDAAVRNELIAALIGVMGSHLLCTVAYGVLSSEFQIPEGMHGDPEFQHFKHPYMTSLIGCLNRIRKVKTLSDVLPDGQIACVVDRDKKHAAKATRVLAHFTEAFPDVFSRTFRLGHATEHVGIQAADVVAYEVMKRMDHVEFERKGRDFRKSTKLLFSTVPNSVGYLGVGAVPIALNNLADHIRSKRAKRRA